MKKLLFLIFTFLLMALSGGLQAQCPSGGVVLETQAQVDAFAVNFPGCTDLPGNLFIGLSSSLSNITDLSPLSAIQSVGGDLSIKSNGSLTSLSGLENLTSLGGDFDIRFNDVLSACSIAWVCDNIDNPSQTMKISGNASGCNSKAEVADNCGPSLEAICQSTTVALQPGGTVSISASDVDGGSTGATSSLVSPANFTCTDIGPNTVTLTVMDGNGNSDACTATVTVVNTDADSDGDGIGDGCDPSININGLAANLSDYVEGLGISSSIERAITRRLDLLVSRFCNGSSVNTVASSANSLVSYIQYQSGNGIPAGDAGYLIAQLEVLIDALYAGAVDCGDGAAARALPGLAGQPAAAESYSLEVYPNPFASEAAIRFYLPQGGQASLEVYNLHGQRVKVLLAGTLDAGQQEQSWDGAADSGQQLDAGIYLVRLRLERGTLTERVSLVR